MEKNYQINLPAGMPSIHPDLSTTVTPSLLATFAERVFHASTFYVIYLANMHEYSALNSFYKDIYSTNLFRNQKKEVNDIILNTKHCKSIQYGTN